MGNIVHSDKKLGWNSVAWKKCTCAARLIVSYISMKLKNKTKNKHERLSNIHPLINRVKHRSWVHPLTQHYHTQSPL